MTAINTTRQYPLVVVQELAAADLVPAGLSGIKLSLPAGALIVDGGVVVVSPLNATGAAVLDIGLSTGAGNALVDNADLKVAGYTPITGKGKYLPTGGDVTITGEVTAGATTGKVLLQIAYVVVGRGNEVQ